MVSGLLIFKLLIVLVLANGAPVLAKKCLGLRWAMPIDGHIRLPDNARIFGQSKTVRGFVLAIVVAALSAPFLGLSWLLGALIGLMAMLGDLLSSFIKRRLRLAPSSRVPGLDQIPESLLPMLAVKTPLALGWIDIVLVVLIFTLLEITLSKLLYRLNIREHPY